MRVRLNYRCRGNTEEAENMELRGRKCKEQGVYVEEEECWVEWDSFKIKEFFPIR